MALLLLLAAAGERGVSRDKLLGLLWPDSDGEHARSALRQTLYSLRRDLALPELFHGTADLRLNQALLQSDLADFDHAVAGGDQERIVAIYDGPLADGFFLTKTPEFERWLEGERSLRAQQFAAAAVARASEASRAGDYARAVVFWRRAATEDRLSARIAVELMRSLTDAGDRAGAIQHARLYENVIRAELDAAPDPAVAALAEQLRSAAGPGESLVRRDASDIARDRELPTLGVPSGTPAVTSPLASSAPARRRQLAPRAALVGVSAVAALAAVAIYALRRSHEPALDPTLVAVAPYRVYDPELALWREGLMDILSRNLDGAGPLRAVTPSIAARYWRGPAHRTSAREFARRTRAGIVVFGYLVRAGADSVRSVTSLIDATSQRTVEVERRESVHRMDRLTDSLTVSLLRQLERWRRIGAVRRTTLTPTTSLEALRAFLRAEQFYRSTEWDSARVWYEYAVGQDSSFALPFQRLGSIYGWQRTSSDSLAEVFKLRAGALNHGLGPRDSLLVLADSLGAAANQAQTRIEEWPLTRRMFAVLDEAIRRYPDDPEIWHALGDARYHFGFGPTLGMPERANLDAFDRAIALDSAFAPAYVHTPELALNLGGPVLARRYIEGYLSLKASGRSDESTRLLRYILTPGASRVGLARVLDTVPSDILTATRTALRRWPDSAETALYLSRRLAAAPRPARYGPTGSASSRARTLALQLAFRGHVREAHRVSAGIDRPITFELAYFGGAPEDSINARITRLVRGRSIESSMALGWWGARRDTAALLAYLAGARRRAASADANAVARATVSYDTAAALAYLALARRDTTAALRRFRALPDTLCARCYTDRLVRARLLAEAGLDREALADLAEPLVGLESPFEVLFAYERGRVAERLGANEQAARAYQFVVDAWRYGDPEVHRYVEEARRGLARIRAKRPRR
jgi:serine/threonine-protein kinase